MQRPRHVIYSALTEMAQSVSLHSLSQTRMGPMPSAGSEGMLSSSIGSQVPSKLGPFVAKLGCVWSERRQELFSFQCENRQISRSESTFSFQSRHMHAPQRGVNGLCVEMRGVFRGCKQGDEELGCTLWFFCLLCIRAFNFVTVSQRVEGPRACLIEMNAGRKMGILGEGFSWQPSGLRNEVAYIDVSSKTVPWKLLRGVVLPFSQIPMRP